MSRGGAGHRKDSGFALLFVFLLSAAIAIVLYKELPRVAFESRRVREEMLIERGEQYRRGIQLFYRKFKRFPPTMEALDETNNIRFLRKRYTDPMTGKDDWRVVHYGPGGVLVDSMVTKPPGQDEKGKQSVNTYIGELPAIGSTAGQTGTGAGGMPPRRASEGGAPVGTPMGDTASQFQTPVSPQPEAESQPGAVPFAPIQVPQSTSSQPYAQQPGGYPQPVGGQPGGILPPGIYPQLIPGQPASAPTAGQLQGPSPIPVPGLPAPYTQPLTQQTGAGQQGSPMTGGPLPFQIPTTPPGSPQYGGGFGRQGTNPSTAAAQNPAARMIMDLLTKPNPQGLAALRQTGGVETGAGGIAGVASKLEADSIKVYNDRTKYQEWEFVYDPRMDRTVTGLSGSGAMQGGPTVPGQQMRPGQQQMTPLGPQQPGMYPQQPGMFPQQPVPTLPVPRR